MDCALDIKEDIKDSVLRLNEAFNLFIFFACLRS